MVSWGNLSIQVELVRDKMRGMRIAPKLFCLVPVAPLLLPGCSSGEPSFSGIQGLIAPEAVVVKLADGMGFTEGPVWLPKHRKLVFSDIPGAALMEWSEDSGLKIFRKSPKPNGNLLDLEGRLLTCRHGARDIVRTEKNGEITILCDRFDGKRFNSPNDVAVKSDGTVWFTDPPWGLTDNPQGKEQSGHYVFRWNPKTGEVTAVLKDIAMPNGIAFSVDERHLYVADTGGYWHPDESLRELPATISAYQVKADGAVNLEPDWIVEGFCDGMCVDALGNIYTTARSGIRVLSPNGDIIGTIEVPEPPSNCCFGGDNYKTLFITARTSLYSIELANSGVLGNP
jgi:gluconolactonase